MDGWNTIVVQGEQRLSNLYFPLLLETEMDPLNKFVGGQPNIPPETN